MAEQMIRFYGFEPGRDIKLIFTGLRPGEKLSETLWADSETPQQTEYSKILRLKLDRRIEDKLDELLEELKPVCFLDSRQPSLFRSRRELKKRIHRIVPTLELHDDES